MALSANKRRTFQPLQAQVVRAMNVEASTEVFVGAIVFIDATNGNAVLDDNAGANRVAGIAQNYYNEDTAAATTDEPLEVVYGHIERMTLAGATAQDVGKRIFASADDTTTLTAAGSSLLGVIHNYVTTNTVDVEINSEMHGVTGV
jgi:hypothetical protein